MSDMRDRIETAIATVMAGGDEMVTKWVACVESVDGEGTRGLWLLANEGAKPWETVGMLMHAVQTEQACITAHKIAEDD